MDTLKALSDSLADLASRATAKVFHVPSSLGGRTALTFDGKLLLVSAQDAARGEAVAVLAPGGREVSATVAGFDAGLGLAVLELSAAVAEAAWTPAREEARLGSLVLVAAYPSPEGPEVRLDALRFSGGEGDAAYLQTDGAAFPGFAGAALVDMEGSIIAFQLADRGGNRGWAIPAARAAALVGDIVAAKSASRAWLGVSTVPIAAPADAAAAFGDGRESALLVSGVQSGSPAAAAGIRVGDILVSVGGAPLLGGEDLVAALAAATPGAELAVVVLRAGERRELRAVPEERSDDDRGPGGRGHRRPWGRGPWWMGGAGCGWGPGR